MGNNAGACGAGAGTNEKYRRGRADMLGKDEIDRTHETRDVRKSERMKEKEDEAEEAENAEKWQTRDRRLD